MVRVVGATLTDVAGPAGLRRPAVTGQARFRPGRGGSVSHCVDRQPGSLARGHTHASHCSRTHHQVGRHGLRRGRPSRSNHRRRCVMTARDAAIRSRGTVFIHCCPPAIARMWSGRWPACSPARAGWNGPPRAAAPGQLRAEATWVGPAGTARLAACAAGLADAASSRSPRTAPRSATASGSPTSPAGAFTAARCRPTATSWSARNGCAACWRGPAARTTSGTA